MWIKAGSDAVSEGKNDSRAVGEEKGDIIRFVQDGVEMKLVPGKTFINIVPNALKFADHVKLGEQS